MSAARTRGGARQMSHRSGRLRFMVAVLAAAAATAGCGSTDTKDSAGPVAAGAQTDPVVAEARADVEKLRTPPGSYHVPDTTTAKAQPGKTVWYISVGNEAESAAIGA